MKNSNNDSLEKKALSDRELYSESASDKTEDEIIFNNCINEEEEEFLEPDMKINQEIQDLNPVEITNKQISNSKNKFPLKSIGNKSVQVEQVKSRKNKFHDYYSPKFDFARKKRKKNEEVKTTDDLFVQALQNNKTDLATNKEYDQNGNTMSTRISDILYNKYVGQNDLKVKPRDVISNIKDEELNIKKEAKRTKDDTKKISDMITRQEKFKKHKQNRLLEKEREINEKINQECVFMPNGISTSSRTPNDFYVSQLKFLEKKEDYINEAQKSKLEKEKKNKKVTLISKASEKIANSKNPNESKEQLYERLHFEKLKSIKENYDKPKEEKKLPKKQVNNLIDKLYKERIILKENKVKREKEKILKETTQEDYISDNSNKVLLTKFLNYYNKILMDLFKRKDNFEINLDEYKLILINMGCVNPNLQSDELLIKESFFKILNPKNDKIDTYSLLLFCLATLGIYKGNDEPKNRMSMNNKSNKIINKDKLGKRLSERKIPKQKIVSFNELIKLSVPDLDMNQHGFSNKIAKNINKKFHTFVKGLNDSWTDDITKKKQERRDKLVASKEKEKKPRATSKKKETTKYNLRTSGNKKNLIPNKNQKNLINKDNNDPNATHKNNTISANTNKYDEIYKRLQQKRDNNLTALKEKKEQEELLFCTFQPNMYKFTSGSKDKENKRNRLNKQQIDDNFEKLYQDGKASYIQKKKSIDPDFDDNLDNKINCTFKPVIHKFKDEVFNKNPIKEELQRFERLRDQKMSILGNKEYQKPMNFYIEEKTNKEDIVDRVFPERYSYKSSEVEKEKETALLKVEVNLDENNNTDKIVIYPGDDVKEKTLKFCLKHKLNEEKKNTLMNIIMEKIEETNNRANLIVEGRKTDRNKTFEEVKKIDSIKDNNDNNEDNIQNIENQNN